MHHGGAEPLAPLPRNFSLSDLALDHLHGPEGGVDLQHGFDLGAAAAAAAAAPSTSGT